ncbi:MAG: heparinase II/III family protein [Rhodospirillales bacterium]|nr:heparinase II/III family protein [Alphaproteobacteria bacterium]MCB9986406.1 heparinase II/III family protein [Rhodospirillales bacterium]USO07046.1 MAG: heparinase II/III family protein [Rhodospirillales bacterium]
MTLLANLFDPSRAHGALRALTRPLYSWSLAGGGIPDRLIVLPPDPWAGDAGRGRWVANRVLERFGRQIPLDSHAFSTYDPVHGAAVHGFEWLRDLRALGGDNARRLGRQMMQEWLGLQSRWQEGVWDFPVTAARLANWLMGYDFFCASGDDHFLHAFYDSLIRQVRHLDRVDPARIAGLDALLVIRAQIFTGLALDGGQDRLEHALGWCDHWIMHELDGEGMHVTRAPATALEAAKLLIEIRAALVRAGVPAPTVLQAAIDRIIHAIRFFRLPDGRFSCLHGGQEDDAAHLDTVQRVSAVRIRKAPSQLESSGFESLVRERTAVLVDCGLPPSHPHDRHHHASPLAFEMCVGRDRMIVHCGTHPVDPVWADHLRATAAHSGLTLDDRNAFEIGRDGHIGRAPARIDVRRDLAGGGVMLTMAHDGYAPLNGLIHTRRMTLAPDGGELTGEDWLTADVAPARPVQYAIRFHLHPRVQASLIQDGRAALLRLPSGAGWRFTFAGNAALTLDASVYCGSGATPRKTQQLVVAGATEGADTRINWALREEA